MSLFSNKLSFGQFKKAPRVVKILTFQQFFEGFIPITALYAIMFERVGGLSFEQIGLLFSIWSLAFLAVELPSGVLADYWSRKNVIILGGLLRAAGFSFWLFLPNFTGYAIGFALWGAMIACSSGAVIALLHTELQHDHKLDHYTKYFGWMASVTTAGMLAGYIFASVFTLGHTDLLIGLSLLSSLTSALILLKLPERAYKKQDTYLKTLKAGFNEIRTSRILRYICYVMFAILMVIGVLEELLPRLFASFGLGDRAISLVLAITLLATIIFLTKLESFVRISLSKQVLLMSATMALMIGGLYLGGYKAVFLVFIFNLVFRLFRMLFQHHIQEVAHGEERATVGSIPGLFAGLLGAGAYALIGKISVVSSERFSIGIYAVFWLIVLGLLAIMGRKYIIKHEATSEPVPVGGVDAGQPSTQF